MSRPPATHAAAPSKWCAKVITRDDVPFRVSLWEGLEEALCLLVVEVVCGVLPRQFAIITITNKQTNRLLLLYDIRQ